MGEGSCGEEYVDLGAELLALKAGCGVGGFEVGNASLKGVDGAEDLVGCGADDRGWS